MAAINRDSQERVHPSTSPAKQGVCESAMENFERNIVACVSIRTVFVSEWEKVSVEMGFIKKLDFSIAVKRCNCRQRMVSAFRKKDDLNLAENKVSQGEKMRTAYAERNEERSLD